MNLVLLHASNLTKAYGAETVLSGVTFRLERREKLALVGSNGCGKTTLLQILAGFIEPDSGSIQLARGAEVGYLSQKCPISLTGTVKEEAEKALQHAISIKRHLEELEKRLNAHPTQEDLDEYATVHEHYLELEGYSAERDLNLVLNRMGFQQSDFDKPASALSGGERTRLALARQILEEPDLLILDEPTNHLDISAVEWLGTWLKGYPGAVLLVSHDRLFLEQVGERFLEMKDGAVKSYPGPYEKYRKLRDEEEARSAEIAMRQDQQIAKLDEFVRRFMNSERVAQARGRLKQKEKLESQRVKAATKQKGINGVLAAGKRSGDVVIEAKNLSAKFDTRVLFEGLNFTATIGQRWGIIGDNGTGKSTLIRILLGEHPPTTGTVKIGANVEAGYFSQDADDLDPERSPLEVFVFECGMSPGEARRLLGAFLLSGDDVFRPIKTLSGGERNKLSLAMLVRSEPNLLILDEPTNHLDMASREALATMLTGYKGTLLLVSHDRWLLNIATNHTLHLRRDAPPVSYPGNYESYRRTIRADSGAAPDKPAVANRSHSLPRLSPREVSKEIGRLERTILSSEELIGHIENQIRTIENQLADPMTAGDVVALSLEHAACKEKLEAEITFWEAQSTRLEELRGTQGT